MRSAYFRKLSNTNVVDVLHPSTDPLLRNHTEGTDYIPTAQRPFARPGRQTGGSGTRRYTIFRIVPAAPAAINFYDTGNLQNEKVHLKNY